MTPTDIPAADPPKRFRPAVTRANVMFDVDINIHLIDTAVVDTAVA
jgi:hypothetical protein